LPQSERLQTHLLSVYLRAGKIYAEKQQYADSERILTKIVSLPVASDHDRLVASQRAEDAKVQRLAEEARRLEETGSQQRAYPIYAELASMRPQETVWQQKAESLRSELEQHKLYDLATAAERAGKWADGARQWFALLGGLKDNAPPFYYEEQNIALRLAVAASRLAKRRGAEIKSHHYYLDLDGQIHFYESADKSYTRRFAISQPILGRMIGAFGFVGLSLGLILGVVMTIVFSIWAVFGVILLIVVLGVLFRPRLSSLREQLSELEPAREPLL